MQLPSLRRPPERSVPFPEAFLRGKVCFHSGRASLEATWRWFKSQGRQSVNILSTYINKRIDRFHCLFYTCLQGNNLKRQVLRIGKEVFMMDSACKEIIRLADKVMDGGEITEEEAKKLIRTKDEDTMLLLAMADKIRQKFNGNAVDFCAIINARSGHCQENCKFCAQSGWYHTGAKLYRLLPEDEILAAARKAKEAGAVRFSLVTSGRNQDNPNEFEEIIDIVKKIREQVGIEVCCSLGLITKEQALRLKEAGITRIHCNIETAPSYFPEVCSTHTMGDKEEIIRTAQEAGIRVCSGGIIGLGESLDQRVEMAFKLKSMHIDSIPMNILNPVKGTPFYTNKRLPPLEVLRTFAMFRFVLPKALIRTAGGREVNLRSLQAYALTGGLNGIMVGGYLTTGGRDPKEDIRMTEDLGRSMTQPQL
jgi:biotin synthase